MKVKSESEVAQSCPTLHDPMDCSLPGSSIHGIFQARVLEWGAIAFSDIPPPVVLKHECTSKSPEGILKTQTQGQLLSLRVELKILHSPKVSGNAVVKISRDQILRLISLYNKVQINDRDSPVAQL